MVNQRISKDLPTIAEFLGWHLGDGCISITNKYAEFALTGDIVEEYPFYNDVVVPSFNRLFREHLTKQANLKKYKSTGVCGLYVFDSAFVSMLQSKFNLPSGKKLTIKVPKIIKTQEQKKDFLRGIFDTDGSIYFCKSNYKTKNESLFTKFHYKPKIKLATIAKNVMEEVYNMLVDLGFDPRVYTPRKQRENENYMYPVVLDRTADTNKWIEEIGFRNVKHSTKVQIWRQFGFCPPFTTLKQRKLIIQQILSPLEFYPDHQEINLTIITRTLKK
jgi:intein/homing endonuclease